MSAKVRIFTSSRVILPDTESPLPATIYVDSETGKILNVTVGKSSKNDFLDLSESDFIDIKNKLIIPGLVDSHVHLNEPGRTDWEGFYTGTQAAASGGVTTTIDMPLNSIPPTTTVENLNIKRNAAKGQCFVDVGFWGGFIPGNQKDLVPLVEAGVKGFKCFLIESGVEEFPCIDETELLKAVEALQDTKTVLQFHAELEVPSVGHEHDDSSLPGNPTHYKTFLDSRPQTLETAAISLVTATLRQSLASNSPLRFHIVHLSASSALPLIALAKEAGHKLSVETCFHYLCLSASSIPNGAPQFKCCPPIREEANRTKLWDGLRTDLIDFVVSDHSPCVAELKKLEEGDIMGAWGGVSSLGLGLPLLLTEGRKRGNFGIRDVVRLCAERTALHAGLEGVKGKIAVGYDADLAIVDEEAEWTVTKSRLNFKNKLSPYEGLTLKSRVERTYLRGKLIYDLGRSENGFEGLGATGKFV